MEKTLKTIARVLRGRKGRISKWFVEIEQDNSRHLLDGHWDSKEKAFTAAQDWARENGVKVTFIVPTRDGR